LDVVDSWMDWCNVIQSTHQSTWWQSKLPLCWCRHWHSSSMKKLPLAIRNISICILLYIIKYIIIYNNI
jgi:hypothetical protein